MKKERNASNTEGKSYPCCNLQEVNVIQYWNNFEAQRSTALGLRLMGVRNEFSLVPICLHNSWPLPIGRTEV